MSSEKHEFEDSEIHAFVDLQLNHARAAELMLAMSKDPELQKRVDDYSRISIELKSLLDPTLKEPIPTHLAKSIETLDTTPTNKQPWQQLLQAAMISGLMLFSGGIGWGLQSQAQNQSNYNTLVTQNLVEPATYAHVVFTPDIARPVEIRANENALLSKWLTNRMKTPLQAPDLSDSGFNLLGGRLLPSTNRMAAQFMYEDNYGSRVTLYIRRIDEGGIPRGFKYEGANGIGSYYWIHEGLGYALSGDINQLPKKSLLKLSEEVYYSNSNNKSPMPILSTTIEEQQKTVIKKPV